MLMSIKMPARIKINSRTSTITNAFFNGILPRINPTDEEVNERLNFLGMNFEKRCVYCGKESQTWDHLNPLIENRKPTGYFTEINNLVPCCNTCNSSKGNINWKTFLENKEYKNGSGVYNNSLCLLEKYVTKYPAKKIDFSDIDLNDLMKIYYEKLDKVLNEMKNSEEIETKLTMILQEKYDKLLK